MTHVPKINKKTTPKNANESPEIERRRTPGPAPKMPLVLTSHHIPLHHDLLHELAIPFEYLTGAVPGARGKAHRGDDVVEVERDTLEGLFDEHVVLWERVSVSVSGMEGMIWGGTGEEDAEKRKGERGRRSEKAIGRREREKEEERKHTISQSDWATACSV